MALVFCALIRWHLTIAEVPALRFMRLAPQDPQEVPPMQYRLLAPHHSQGVPLMKPLLLVAASLLSAQAFAADTLTVYTYSSFAAEWGPGPKIKQAFEQECAPAVAAPRVPGAQVCAGLPPRTLIQCDSLLKRGAVYR